jgi:hypothetical protein
MDRRKDGGMAVKMPVQAMNEWVVLSLDAWELGCVGDEGSGYVVSRVSTVAKMSAVGVTSCTKNQLTMLAKENAVM